MMIQAVSGPRAWTAASVDDRRSWYCPLPDACRVVFEAMREVLRKAPQPLTEVRLPESARGPFTAALGPVRAALESGRGFAVVHSPAGWRLPEDDLRLLYWAV